MLSDEGLADAKIGTSMGHTDAQTTRRYTTQRDVTDAARAVEDWLFSEEGAA
jgi:integrase